MSLEAWGDEDDTGVPGYVTEEHAQDMVDEAIAELQAWVRELEQRAQRVHQHAWVTLTIWPSNYTVNVHSYPVATVTVEAKTAEGALAAMREKLDESDPALWAADFTGVSP